jgi:hypothetical protein
MALVVHTRGATIYVLPIGTWLATPALCVFELEAKIVATCNDRSGVRWKPTTVAHLLCLHSMPRIPCPASCPPHPMTNISIHWTLSISLVGSLCLKPIGLSFQATRINNNTFKIILQLVIVFANSTNFTPNILYNVASFQSIKILQYYRSFKCPVIWLTISTGPFVVEWEIRLVPGWLRPMK